MRRARKPKGSVVFNKLRSTWNLLWVESGQRKSRKLGTLAELPTKADADRQAESVRRDVRLSTERRIPTVREVAEKYRTERMPERFSTRYGYEAWLKNHVLPRWGAVLITEVQPREVELWLRSLELSPKSRVHIRGVLHQLWEFAMWCGQVPAQRNPMELVKIKGATKRTRQPRSLTVEEFQAFISNLAEPFRTIALLCICLGLRISECLALKWADVNWLESKLLVERGIVRQRVGEVKTEESRKHMTVCTDLLEVLKVWKQATQFSAPEDWVFASPAQLGRLPWSYPQVWKVFQKAGEEAGIGKISTHTMRHTYRTWLDSTGTPIGVQQKLMRHADIRTTMNIYGDAATEDMKQAHSKVVRMAIPRA